MPQLTDEQVDIIQQRIIDDNITNTGLQQDLLDHYCCFIENEMTTGSDFETGYNKAFRAITPNGMHEIEEELFFLLTFKKQTNMKKIILATGAVSSSMLVAGIILKYLFTPGASALIASGIVLTSIVFMPMVFILKMRERRTIADKALWGIGTLFAMVIALSVLFKVQHWPGANILGTAAPAILLFLFLPVYFFSGIRNIDTRVNTVVTSVFIIVGCGLFFTLLMTPRAVRIADTRITKNYLRNERILRTEQKELTGKPTSALSKEIFARCEELKTFLIKCETGVDVIGDDFENKKIVISDHSAMDYFHNTPVVYGKLKELGDMVARYNTNIGTSSSELLPASSNIIDFNEQKVAYRIKNALDDLVQIQMMLLQNEKGLASL